jgi:Na+-translocating ferredoxin:NAD+ oxidoreductase RnfE subunit
MPGMTTLMALTEAAQTTIALLAVFGVVFPAIVTGCIIFAAAQAAAERQQNLERRHGRAE